MASDGYLSSASHGDYKDAASQLIGPDEDELIMRVSNVHVLEMTETALDTAGQLVGAPAIRAADPLILEITESSAQRVVQINGATRRAVQRSIVAGQAAGYSPYEIAYGSTRTRKDKYRPLKSMVDMMYRGRPECIARTEMAFTNNEAQIRRFQQMGMNTVEVYDGPDCGWESHQDPDKANGTTRSMNDALSMLISHPNCVRSFVPTLIPRR